MITDGLEFTGDSLETQALGGSETAFIYVARELAKLGNHVRVFCKCSKEGKYDNVQYFDNSKIKDLAELGESDILIVSRFVQFFGIKFNSKLNILWNHDILMEADPIMSMVWNIDYMYCLSKFHEKQYAGKLHDIKNIIKIIPNGIDPDIVQQEISKITKEHRIMFTSRSERGLFKALELYEKLGDKNLEFIACSYGTFDTEEVARIEELCNQKMVELGQKGFDIKQARYTKEDLYREIAKSKAVIYPTQFPEIFCISAIEAQANGTAYITTDDFAMKETVGYQGISLGDNYDELFLQRMKKVIYIDQERQVYERQGLEHVEKYTWKNVAKKILKDATEYFKKRSKDQAGIIERMIYNSDLVMAREVLKKIPKGDKKTDELYEKLDHDLRFVDGKKDYDKLYEDESTHEAIDQTPEQSEMNGRFRWFSKNVAKTKAETVLDYACHMGASTILASNRNPNAKVTGFDISHTAIAKAKTRAEKTATSKNNLNFIDNKDEITEKKYDLLFCGEMLEHVIDPEATIVELESYVRPGGTVLFTVPKGAWEYIKHEDNHKRDVIYHVHGYEYWDLIDMFGKKPDFKVETVRCFSGVYDESLGNFLISYTADHKPIGRRDLKRKLLTTRPHQTISACIIAYNAAKEIEGMIESIHTEMDEIIVGIDPATTDETRNRLNKYYKVRILEMPKTIQGPDFWGFANARNWVTSQAIGKWIFWIDTDEKIVQTEVMRKYLEGTVINAFVVRQHHAQFDNFIVADNPHRLYRAGTGEFVGFIHEQPQAFHNINEPIEPALILNGVDIVNLGEMTEGIRRNKAVGRNLELLKIDMAENVDKRKLAGLPIRKLSIILLMRDFYNRIRWNIERYQTTDTKDCHELCLPKIKALFYKYFQDETDPIYRDMAESIMQNTYNDMRIGIPCEIKIEDKTYPRRVDKEDIERLLDEIREALMKKLTPPTVI